MSHREQQYEAAHDQIARSSIDFSQSNHAQLLGDVLDAPAWVDEIRGRSARRGDHMQSRDLWRPETPMLRKRIESLTVEDGRYSYDGEPYSGVAFESKEGRSVKAILMEKGEVVSAYQPPYFSIADYPSQIDLSGFTEDCLDGDADAPLNNGDDLAYDLSRGCYDLLVRGKPYSGVAYEFFRENCVREFRYINGRLVSRAGWYLSGHLRYLHLHNDAGQFYEWHSSGRLTLANIVHYGKTPGGASTFLLNGGFGFFDDGSLKWLHMDKAFVSFFEKSASEMIYRPIEKIKDICLFKGGERLTLLADGIDDETFSIMLHGGVFDTTSELVLFRTLVSDSDPNLEALSNTRIKKLTFDSNEKLGTEFMNKLRRKRPDLKIEIRPRPARGQS